MSAFEMNDDVITVFLTRDLKLASDDLSDASFYREIYPDGSVELIELDDSQEVKSDGSAAPGPAAAKTSQGPQRAAGIMHLTRDGHTLMVHRTDGAGWAFPGGGIEDAESAEEAARREHFEEMGKEHAGPLELHTRRIDDRADFTTFIARDSETFTPVLNDEHDGFAWIDRHDAVDQLDLHPGARVALLKDDMDELSIAKAIATGELISPQRYKNLWLFAMRITGTGAAYRLAEKQFTWRDPQFYLNDEFLQRCAGLPVILQHPEDDQDGSRIPGTLNGAELSERIVGTILYPYLLGPEVWGIAKVYDEVAAGMLCKKQLSTSPCVVLRPEGSSSKYRLQDGSILLIEGKPALLDHLAIDELGVWDKGGEPSGVLNQLGDSTMAGEKVAPVAADSEKEGSLFEKILAKLDSNHNEFVSFRDSMTTWKDAFGKKEESGDEGKKEEPSAPEKEQKTEGGTKFEVEVKPAEEKKEEKTGEKVEGEGPRDEKEGKSEPLAADSTEGAESPKVGEALKEEREENGLSKNDCSTETPMADTAKNDSADVERLRAQIAEMNSRIPVEMPEGERVKFSAAQEKSERVHQAFGDSAGAPRPLNGETLNQYRRRLMTKHQKHSPDWKDTDLSKINDDAALSVIEDKVYADAMKAARTPTDLGEGQLRMVTETDEAGRKIKKFYGDPEACWAPFKSPPQIVAGWTTKFN